MKRQRQQNFLKRFPVLKSVMEYCLKKIWDRIELLIVTGGLSLLLTTCQHKKIHNQIWNEAGPHLLDEHNEIYSNADAINALSNRLAKVESMKKP